ncbi:hypothetical protein [Dyadobacter crusticola]|uniref:hypothetical protein n=1 Tax=Dyadobacter crusticola TaxID=292407 RepID=UPI0004E28C24|nr:hypothetical protein [Dyadobacter crusticola]
MRYTAIVAVIASLLAIDTVKAQDFFEDLQGESTPVLGGANNGALLSARANIGDNSLKLNLFKIFQLKKPGQATPPITPPSISIPGGVGAPQNPYNETSHGFGLSFKVKTEDGLGSVFTSSKFASGFSGGGYYALRRVFADPINQRGSFKYTILSGLYTRSQFRFYRPQNSFDTRLSDFRPFDGFTFGLSTFGYSTLARDATSGQIFGGSLTFTKTNNYSALSKVEVKRLSNTPYGTPADSIQSVTLVDDNGATYAEDTPDDEYEESFKLRLRGNYAYIPGALDSRVALIFSPTLNYGFTQNQVTADLNIGLHLLKKGQPTISLAGIFFEFSDIGNTADDSDPFLKRSFAIGVMVGLNVLSNTIK